jgi:hypothetical protein
MRTQVSARRFIPLVFLCIVSFSTCAKMPAIFSDFSGNINRIFTIDNPSRPHFFYSFPGQNGLVFIGAAGKRSNANETLKLALEDAARRVAVFYRVSGEFAVQNNIGSGMFDYTHRVGTKLHYNVRGASQYIDALQFDADIDTFEMGNTFFIRTVFPAALPSAVNYSPVYNGANKKPDWVDNPPNEIEGYEVGIGYSGRYSSMATTYRNSRNNAIFSIIRNINTFSTRTDILYETTESLFGYKTSNDNTTYSFGTLSGFYVLDTWIEPRTNVVWTLAIAGKI